MTTPNDTTDRATIDAMREGVIIFLRQEGWREDIARQKAEAAIPYPPAPLRWREVTSKGIRYRRSEGVWQYLDGDDWRNSIWLTDDGVRALARCLESPTLNDGEEND